MSKQMTYVEALNGVLDGKPIEGELRERIEALRDSQMKRAASKSNGETKEQRERKALAEKVFEAMELDVVYSTADISNLVPELAGAFPQKITPLMRLLGDRITTTKAKGKNCYSINPDFTGDAE